MLVCLFGLPSAPSYWALHVLRMMVEEALGNYHYFEPMELESMKRGVAERKNLPLILFSDSPDKGVREAIVKSGARILVLTEDLPDVVGYCIETRNQKPEEALRFSTQCLSCIFGFKKSDNVFVLDRKYFGNVSSFLDKMNLYFDLELSASKIYNLLMRIVGDVPNPESISAEACILRQFERARPPGEFMELAESVGLEPFREMLDQYENMLREEYDTEIIWPRECFLDGDNPGTYPPARIDLTGRARHIFFGPYLHLPPGSWTATIAFLVEDNLSGNRMQFDVLEQGKSLTICVVDLPPHGRYKLELDFEVSDARKFLEVRAMSMFGAIEGWFSLLWVKLARR